MNWYLCIVTNQYDGVQLYEEGVHYKLPGTPSTDFFTATPNYASSTVQTVGPGLTVDIDGNLAVSGDTITKNGVDTDGVSTEEAAADTAIRDAIQLQSDTTINLLVADSTAEKQAKIDAVARQAIQGVSATFQFADGTHTETAALVFDGFQYPIFIQGNDSDTTLSTTKTVIVTGSFDGDMFQLSNNRNAEVRYMEIENTHATSSGRLVESLYGECTVRACYLNKTTSSNGDLYYAFRGYNRSINTYYGGGDSAIYSSLSMLLSLTNDDDAGNQPQYGLTADNGGVVGKSSTQPAGSVSNESTGSGGVVR